MLTNEGNSQSLLAMDCRQHNWTTLLENYATVEFWGLYKYYVMKDVCPQISFSSSATFIIIIITSVIIQHDCLLVLVL